ncbi:MAG TPA: DUF2723 domain-containing protein [Vicinamibacterales bacterium]|nr:DUF2723 domain-containing protein [Vicinamibacterales bacterium]
MTVRSWSAAARDLLMMAAAAAASLFLYALTLQPDFGGPEDTPKFQFVGYVLGIPHPPGYPFYVLLSHLFVSLPIGTIAYRANLFSAVMAAVACALAYSIARQLGARRWTALCAALGLATGVSFWRSAVFAEVYSLAAVMAGLTVTLLLAWGARNGTWRLVSAFGAFAFGLGNHLTIVGVVPAFAAYVLSRGRRIWSLRMVAACTLLLALGLAQYGLILIRTRQGAPYIEVGAYSVRDLIGVVTAERFAAQRFAFGPAELLTDHLPALALLIARELGPVGTVLVLVGVISGLRRANELLVVGATAGMLMVVLNLSGDLKGFITPLMVLLWPLAAVGVETVARYVRSIHRVGSAIAALVLAGAALLPVTNLVANYREADQSGHTADARFLRAVFSQLPDGSRFVTEDYWSDMAWRYYRSTGEAGPDRGTSRLDFEAAAVRQAAADRHRVFSFAFASTFLATEGLHFTRAAVEGPPVAQWLASLPRGSVLVAAMAYAPSPADLAVVGHANARAPGRLRSFETFALIVGEEAAAWRKADDEVLLRVDAESLPGPHARPEGRAYALPTFAGAIVASAGAGGARVILDGRTVARVENGAAFAVFAPDGTLVRTLELPPGESPDVPFTQALYELAGESRCAALSADRWTDIGPVLASGGWVATMSAVGSIVIETVVPGAHDLRARSTVLLGQARTDVVVAPGPEGGLITTQLIREGESRPVFRLALDRPQVSARARVRPGGAAPSATVCAFNAMRTLFEPDGTAAVITPDFESEPFFGAGWSGAQRSPTGPERRGADGATLFIPLERGRRYRLLLDVAEPVDLDVTLNGVRVGACDAVAGPSCELLLPAETTQSGINSVTLNVRREPAGGSRVFRFRRARITSESTDRR